MSIRNLESKHYFTRRSHNFITDINMFCHGVQEILSYFLGNWRDCWCFHLACNHVTSQKCLCLHHWLWVCVCGGGEGLSLSGSLPVCVYMWGKVDGDCMACSVYYRHNLYIYNLPSHVPMLRCCTIRNCYMCFILNYRN